MDKILLIDAHNAMWRGNVFFGTPLEHKLCESPQDEGGHVHPCNGYWCEGKNQNPHCTCKSPWNVEERYCYGQKYLIIYNFFRNLRPIIEQFAPDKCFFVLEGHPQFRYDLFPEYKANRLIKQASQKENLDKFLASKNEIVRLMQHLPVTIARAAHFECDDVIATLCEDMRDEDLTVLSNDSDYIQLLQRGYKSCKIYNPISKAFMKAPAHHYVAWKCLSGDTADNIPGFDGIGDKKAQKLLADPIKFQEFMSVEENRANFNIYKSLIEFQSVPIEDISLQEGEKNFLLLKKEFENMKFDSITNDKSWLKFTTTFNCIKF